MQLFTVLMGGDHAGSKVEVHDVLFAAGESLESLYPLLKAHWFGSKGTAHIDAWIAADGVEGYSFEYLDHPVTDDSPRLFLINYGGYQAGILGENHDFHFVVAKNAAAARAQAKKQLKAEWIEPHVDAVIAVERVLLAAEATPRYLHLTAGPHGPASTECRYIPLK